MPNLLSGRKVKDLSPAQRARYERVLANNRSEVKWNLQEADGEGFEVYEHPLPTLAAWREVEALPELIAEEDASPINPDLWSEELERELMLYGVPAASHEKREYFLRRYGPLPRRTIKPGLFSVMFIDRSRFKDGA